MTSARSWRSEQPALTPQEVLAVLQSAVGTVLDLDPASIAPDLRFIEDLRADSLALVEIVDVIEEWVGAQRPGFTMADEDLDDLLTVGDALDHVVARLGATPPGPR